VRDDISIRRWYDGQFRPKSIWQAEALEILHEDWARRGGTAEDFLGHLEDEGRKGWGEDLPAILELWAQEVKP
jgi:hypothetical protein